MSDAKNDMSEDERMAWELVTANRVAYDFGPPVPWAEWDNARRYRALAFLATARALLAPKPDAATVEKLAAALVPLLTPHIGGGSGRELAASDIPREIAAKALEFVGAEVARLQGELAKERERAGTAEMDCRGARNVLETYLPDWKHYPLHDLAHIVTSRLESQLEAARNDRHPSASRANLDELCRYLNDIQATNDTPGLRAGIDIAAAAMLTIQHLRTQLEASRLFEANATSEAQRLSKVALKLGEELEAARQAIQRGADASERAAAEIRAQAFEEIADRFLMLWQELPDGDPSERGLGVARTRLRNMAIKARDACNPQPGATPEQATRDPVASRVVADGKVHWCGEAPAEVTTENLTATIRRHNSPEEFPGEELTGCDAEVITAAKDDIRANLARAADRFQVKLSEVEAGWQKRFTAEAERAVDEDRRLARDAHAVQKRADDWRVKLLSMIGDTLREVRPETMMMQGSYPDLVCRTLREWKVKIAELEAQIKESERERTCVVRLKNDRIAELKAKLARRTELLRTLRNHVPGKDLWRWYVEVDRELFPFHVKDGKVWHGEKKPAKLPEPGETVWVKAPVTGRLASLGGVLLVGQSNTLHVENHAETWLRDDEVRKP